MYVCLCVGLTEKEIKDAIDQGNDTLDLLMEEHGVALGCSICKEEIEKILKEKASSVSLPVLDIHPNSQ